MRLIDGDALIAWIKESQHMTSKMRNIICKVETMPSADRPQGEWLAVSSYDAFGGSEELWNAHGNPTAFHYCSKCKAQSYVNEFGEELLTDYCPNCGAQMKGADDE